MKQCPKPIAYTLLTGLHLLCKEPNQLMGSRKNILVVQALQVVQVALAYAPMDLGNIVLAVLRDVGVQGLLQP